jgi:hypothetical protein
MSGSVRGALSNERPYRDPQFLPYAIEAGDLLLAPGIKKLLKQAVAIGRRRDRLADSTLAL